MLNRPLAALRFLFPGPLLCLFLYLLCAQSACAPQTLVLVRHGEKLDESDDAQLSPAGEARAARLAELLAPLNIKAIFVSERLRTQQTAQPLAQRLGITPTVIPARERSSLTSRLRSAPKSDVALVVGHSNTLPMIFAELGVDAAHRPTSIEYADVFILIRRAPGSSTLLRLHAT